MKKVYNRTTKRWETEEEINIKLKKRETCKGGREHDWVRVLPYGVEALPHYNGDVEPYYQAEKLIYEITNKTYDALETLGIKVRRVGLYSYRQNTRSEMCTICKKKRSIDV